MRLLLFCFVLILSLSGCGSSQVLKLPRNEAAAMLESGNLSFIHEAELADDFSKAKNQLKQLLRIHPAAPFYAGLLTGEDQREKAELEILLYLSALESPSLPARREASLKLIPIILELRDETLLGKIQTILNERKTGRSEAIHSLRAACMYSLGFFDDALGTLSAGRTNPVFTNSWDRAIQLLSSWKKNSLDAAENENLREEILSFLTGIEEPEILLWAYNEITSHEEQGPSVIQFNNSEIAAISARLTPQNYGRGALLLSQAMEDGGSIFFRYPNLIAYLGRSFQFTTGIQEEGAYIFRAWSSLLDEPGDKWGDLGTLIGSMDSEKLELARFMVYFYAGRITRALGEFGESMEYFQKALDLAPNKVQSDAALWYMLMNALAMDPEEALHLALDTMERWDDMTVFLSIMDRLSNYMVRKRQWESINLFFNKLEEGEIRNAGAILAQFSYITGRAAEEGFLNIKREPDELFNIAFNEGKNSYYYRAMAASKLGKTLVPETDNARPGRNNAGRNQGSEIEFLLGFYEYGASAFARQFINKMESELSILELRAIAEAMAESGRLQESMNFTSRYKRLDDYEINRQDLYLFYPQPYRELIEKYAHEHDLNSEILYGLIHTESHFMSNAVSRVGALGLSQLMPATAEEMAERIQRLGGPDYRGANFREPEINIHIGSFYLRRLEDLMGNPMLALLAYNGGQGRVRRWLAEENAQGPLPLDLFLETVEIAETRDYGRKVLAAAAVYGYLYYGLSMEAVADKIFLNSSNE